MKSIYKVYRDRLVEITGKSRSLYSKNLSKKQTYNLGKLFGGAAKLSAEFCDFIWNRNVPSFRLFSPSQISNLLRNINSDEDARLRLIESEQKRLVALKREVEELAKDTGRYELFLGYPFVEGVINNNVSVKAPLLLFSARIATESGIELVLPKDEPVQLNKVFLLAYAREMSLNIDDVVTEFESFSERFSSIDDVIEYLNSLSIKIGYSGQKSIADIESSKENHGSLQIRHYCVLGRFPLANSIYYDYQQMLAKKLSNLPLEALLGGKEIRKPRKNSQERLHFSAHSLDYAQELAVEKCHSEQNLVIYGPPGTGKSQTIAGIIVDNLCKNKRVLVISQKRAALDVVYKRLSKIISKVIMLPDPEKNKNEFYIKVRERYRQILDYKPQFDSVAFDKCCAMLDNELRELSSINNVLFEPTALGPSLQSMYSMSSNIGKKSADYAIYTAMQKSELMRMDFSQLCDSCTSILQRKKGKLFYDHMTLQKSNPLVDFVRTDIDIHTLNQAKTFLNALISKKRIPFNIANFEYSRYVLVYRLEKSDDASLLPLADMIVRSQNPILYHALALSHLPIFWLAYPILKVSYRKIRKHIHNKLLTAENAVRHYINEFDLLKAVLEPEGFAMVADSIAFGNDKFLKKLLCALGDYTSLRTMRLAAKDITPNELTIINFAMQLSKTRNEFYSVLEKIVQVRIYHGVIEQERKKEQILSKTIVFEDIRRRIVELKNQQKTMSSLLAEDSYNEECLLMFSQNPEKTKDFLHQINKQRDIWPVRRLMQHFEQFLTAMFPCWLLSPETASSVLPLRDGLFDVVLFDEASQLFIESTIPAIYRAKSLVVAGDDKQLRPTSVFVKRYMGDDSYDESQSLSAQALLEVESLLDLASSRLQATQLNYHYRSMHEELINFSNHAFYGGKLQIAPNISKNKNFLPIERIMVNGIWENRRNHAEACEVVELVKDILKNRKNSETLGIVTFNTEQEEYIKDLLDKECRESMQFRIAYQKELGRQEKGEDKSIFVKNLENVQGEERDIIIFSVAYAKNADGKLNSHFGTLSMTGGENRLNVAITRAVKKIYVVTSIEPEEFINISACKNDGPKLLVNYLKYVRAVSKRNNNEVKDLLSSLSPTTTATLEPKIDNFVLALKKEIERLGYEVDTNLGNTDYKISLAVYDASLDRYLLGIECDYSAHASSSSMMERDVYRIDFLCSRGWDIMRVWSRDWWLNKSALIKQIENRLRTNKRLLLDAEKTSTVENIVIKNRQNDSKRKQKKAN